MVYELLGQDLLLAPDEREAFVVGDEPALFAACHAPGYLAGLLGRADLFELSAKELGRLPLPLGDEVLRSHE